MRSRYFLARAVNSGINLVLRLLRRILVRVDTLITRHRFGEEYFQPPKVAGARREWREFFNRIEGEEADLRYRQVHIDRLVQTMLIVPPPRRTGCALELGCYMHMAAGLGMKLGYREVRGAYYGSPGVADRKTVNAAGKELGCSIDLFDAERDRFPYDDGSFDLVLACEILEHLKRDPMHMMSEIRRVLADGAFLILTTPNSASLGSVIRALHGYQSPQIFSCYPDPGKCGEDTPHVREYTPYEIKQLLAAAGFQADLLFTDRIGGYTEGTWALELLAANGFETELRGEQIYCRAIKDPTMPVNRYPSFLYAG